MLQAQKAEALARDDHLEAARIRDCLQALQAALAMGTEAAKLSGAGAVMKEAVTSQSPGQSTEPTAPPGATACEGNVDEQNRTGTVETKEALEAQKIEAISRNDFAEAVRLRDRLRMLAKEEESSDAPASRNAIAKPAQADASQAGAELGPPSGAVARLATEDGRNLEDKLESKKYGDLEAAKLALEAQKMEALARNDFAEAVQLRDRLRMLAKEEGSNDSPASRNGIAKPAQAHASQAAAEPGFPSGAVARKATEDGHNFEDEVESKKYGDSEAAKLALEAQKMEALARNDFAEAARLRDRLRGFTKRSDGAPAPGLADRRKELERKKEVAIRGDDFAQAALLRDQLRDLELEGLRACGSTRSAEAMALEAEEEEAILAAAAAATRTATTKRVAATKEAVKVKPLNAEQEEDEQTLTCAQRCIVYPIAFVLAFVFLAWVSASLKPELPNQARREL